MKLRSPLSHVLGSGSAKEGTDHWWAQRVTAVGLVILGLWFLFALLQIDNFDHAQIVRWVGQPFSGVMLILLCLTLGVGAPALASSAAAYTKGFRVDPGRKRAVTPLKAPLRSSSS